MTDRGRGRATERLAADDAGVARAAALLAAGGVVAIPTETVYGLAVRADDADAVARVFAAKGRPADNPLIVHVVDAAGAATVATGITPLAERLLARFAPGPLTVVLPARPELPRATTGGLDTVAVRVPAHPVARRVLAACGLPLAAPSANRSGRPSPTTAAHVLADLDGRIDAVLDGGPTDLGLESTVVDARGDLPVVLREGSISREDLAAAGAAPADAGTAASDARAPGTRHHHYAPGIPVHVAPPGTGGALASRLAAGAPGRVGMVRVGPARPDGGPDGPPGDVRVLADLPDAAALGAALFGLLRTAEDDGLAALVVEGVAPVGVGRAVMDRLTRAAAASGGSGGAGGAGGSGGEDLVGRPPA